MAIKNRILFLVIIVVLGALFLIRGLSKEDGWICVDDAWVKHGHPSAPAPTSGCGVAEIANPLPVNTIGNAGCRDLRNVNLVIEQPVISPIKITGEARGTWFFEASFPVTIVNWDGLIIGQGAAQAKTDPANPDGGVNWMTTDFIPFEVELKFDKPDYKDNGAIIFQKDNPSGLPEHDASCEVPILFK